MLPLDYQNSYIEPCRVFFRSIHSFYNNYIYEGKVKSSSLAYNRRETRDKRQLGRDPDTNW